MINIVIIIIIISNNIITIISVTALTKSADGAFRKEGHTFPRRFLQKFTAHE
jgi:hypothetical protein